MFLIFGEVPSRENGRYSLHLWSLFVHEGVHGGPDCVYVKVVRTSHGLVNMWNGTQQWKTIGTLEGFALFSCASCQFLS